MLTRSLTRRRSTIAAKVTRKWTSGCLSRQGTPRGTPSLSKDAALLFRKTPSTLRRDQGTRIVTVIAREITGRKRVAVVIVVVAIVAVAISKTETTVLVIEGNRSDMTELVIATIVFRTDLIVTDFMMIAGVGTAIGTVIGTVKTGHAINQSALGKNMSSIVRRTTRRTWTPKDPQVGIVVPLGVIADQANRTGTNQ